MAATGLAQSVEPFEIGLLRVDSALVPIGAYGDQGWEPAWPDLTEAQDESGSGEGSRLLYFVARKTYTAPTNVRDPGCYSETVATGWLWPVPAGRYRISNGAAMLTDCDWKQITTYSPLSTIRTASGRTFWIVRADGYEHEEYAILDIRSGDVRRALQVYGGGC